MPRILRRYHALEQTGGQPARTEAELRAALATLERHAPEADEVLSVLAVSPVRRHPWRPARPHRPLLLGGGLAMAAAAAAAGLVVATMAVNPGAVPSLGQVKLAASTVRHVATVTKTAMASSGHVIIVYSTVTAGKLDVSGTLDITFSGSNFNSVSRQPGAQAFTERVVDGQIYTFGDPPPGAKLQWYHSVNEASQGQGPIPDPRRLLFSLRPDAGFVVLGWQILGGARLEHLHATDLRKLPDSILQLGKVLYHYNLTSLDVWIDRQSIVRQMAMTFQDPGRSGPLYAQSFLVKFLDIGRTQTITPPSHYAGQHTYG